MVKEKGLGEHGVGSLLEPIRRYPWYVVCTALYWLWTGLVFQGPAFLRFESPFVLGDIPAWWMPMLLYALSYVIIGTLYHRATGLVHRDCWPVVVAAVMAVGVLMCICWMYLPLGFGLGGVVLYLVGVFCVSFGAACFLSIAGRFNGYVGSRLTLVVSVEGMLLAVIVMAVLSILPRMACNIFLFVLPALFVICILRIYKIFTKNKLFILNNQKLVKPKKLLLTSALHGLPFGLILTLLDASRADTTTLAFNATCFGIGAVSLLVVMAYFRLDFNQLIYLFGFPLMAFGLLLVVLLPDALVVGCAVLTVGYTCVHLIMCGVNSYLVKQFGLPMPWILSWTTCFFMLGQVTGVLIGFVVRADGLSVELVGVVVLFVFLIATLFLVDNRNMQYGWGVARPSGSIPSENVFALGCQYISADYRLTEREAEVLAFLAIGRSRKYISGELSVGEETVKTHVRSIYAKLGVHTKEELIALVEAKVSHLEP